MTNPNDPHDKPDLNKGPTGDEGATEYVQRPDSQPNYGQQPPAPDYGQAAQPNYGQQPPAPDYGQAPQPGYGHPAPGQPVPGQPYPGQPAAAPYGAAPQYSGNPAGPPPDNNMVSSIIVTVVGFVFACSCLSLVAGILGIIAIVKANSVNTLWNSGDTVNAQKAADDAKKFSNIAWIIFAVSMVLWIIYIIWAVATGGGSWYYYNVG